MFSIGRIIRLIILGLVVAGLIYTGVWHYVTLFIWQNPMLTWVPLLVFSASGSSSGPRSRRSARPGGARDPGRRDRIGGLARGEGATASATGIGDPGRKSRGLPFSFGWGFLAALAVLLVGVWFTWISKPALGVDEIEYTVVEELPAKHAAAAPPPLRDQGRPGVPRLDRDPPRPRPGER